VEGIELLYSNSSASTFSSEDWLDTINGNKSLYLAIVNNYTMSGISFDIINFLGPEYYDFWT
jgi:hypothetical protein